MNKLLIYQIVTLFILYLGYGFYYYTRKSISFMLPHFSGGIATSSSINFNASGSFNLTKNDIGIIISSQNIAYAISKFISGILSDIVSVRILFGSCLFLSGLLNVGFRKDINIYSIYSISFLIGLVQGPSWPCCSKLLQKWIPKSQFGTWWSILSTAANVSGALGPIIATSIALKYHWTYGFMIPGCICMSIGYIAIIFIRNKPSDVKGLKDINPSEDEEENEKKNFEIKYLFKETNKKSENDQKNHSDSDQENSSQLSDDDESDESLSEIIEKTTRFERIKQLFSYTFFISICLAYFQAQLLKTLMSDWTQVYLIKIHKIKPFSASYFVSVFEFSGIFGSILSGIITDVIYHRYKSQVQDSTKIRMALVRYYFILSILALHLFNFYLNKNSTDFFLISVGFTLGFCFYGSIALLGVIAMEFTSTNLSGTSHAIVTLWANFGAIIAGLPFGYISRVYSWSFAFKLAQYLTIFITIILFIFKNSKSKFESILDKNVSLSRKTK